MAKDKKKKPRSLLDVPHDEEQDIAATRSALGPVLKAGLTTHRIASAAGAHAKDMQGFLDGRLSLTWELRKRLRDQIPSLLESADPNRVL